MQDGSFRIPASPGLYAVNFTADGYQGSTRQDVVIGGGTTYLEARLVPLAVSSPSIIGSVTVRASSLNTSAAAVSSTTTQSLRDSGISDLRRVLDQIPGLTIQAPTSAGNNVPGSPYNQLLVSIRGAQPYETALLIDGHHVTTDSVLGAPFFSTTLEGPDLQAFDLNAFSRIDVVKGPGATSSTVNGSVGGTVNLISTRPSGPIRGTFDVGYDGLGTTTYHAGAAGETTNHRFSFKIDETAINTNFPILPSTDIIGPGFVSNLPVNGQHFYCVGVCSVQPPKTGVPNFYSEPVGFFACCLGPQASYGYRHQTSADVRFDLAPHVTASVLYSVTNQLAQGAAFDITSHPFNPPTAYTGPIAPGTAVNYSSGAGPPAATQIFRLNQLVEYGLDSDIGTLHIRASLLAENPKAQQLYLPEIPAGAYTFYGVGAIGATPAAHTQIFNGTPETIGSPVHANFDVSNITYNHDWLLELTQPLRFGTLRASFDDFRSSGAQESGGSYYQVLPADPLNFGNRTRPLGVTGLFEDFKTERLTYDAPLARSLSGTASLYVNQYYYNAPQYALNATLMGVSGLASSFVAPRAGLVWQPTPSVAVRFSAGSAVVPLPIEYFEIRPSLAFTTTCPGGGSCYTSSLVPSRLQPEASFGEDLGTDTEVHHFTTLSADLYHTLLHGQFYTDSENTGVCNDGMHGTLPCFTSQVRNLGQSRYYGLEFKISHVPPIGLTWAVSGALERAYVYNVPTSFYASAAGPLTTNLTIVPEVNYNGFAGGLNAVPYAQGYANVGYRTQHVTSSLGATYYGANNTYFVPAFIVLDAQAIYQLDHQTSIAVTAGNIGNVNSAAIANFTQYRYLSPQVSGTPTNILYENLVGPPTLAVTLRRLIGR